MKKQSTTQATESRPTWETSDHPSGPPFKRAIGLVASAEGTAYGLKLHGRHGSVMLFTDHVAPSGAQALESSSFNPTG